MNWLRDWWRGWSDDDLVSVLNKITLQGCDPGALIYVTYREMKALMQHKQLGTMPRCTTLYGEGLSKQRFVPGVPAA